jgi:Ca2+ transporting ATPase
MVGKNSCVGKIMGKLEQKIETTPLQEKLEAIGSDIGKLGMYAALLTVHVLFLRFFVERISPRSFILFDIEDSNGNVVVEGEFSEYLEDWLEYFIIGVTIIVVAVPEGLPLAVMISLAYSVKKMLMDQNFVKRLASCEIMGGANNICSDKTGTLTMNKMTVTNIWAGKDIALRVNDPSYRFEEYFNNKKHPQLLSEAVCLNTTAMKEEGNATEIAMLTMIDKFGVDYK